MNIAVGLAPREGAGRDEREDDDWADVASNDPNDHIGYRIKKSPETLEYPFEFDWNDSKVSLMRAGNVECPFTKGFLSGQSVPRPDSRENFWSPLPRDQAERFLSMIPADTRERFREFSFRMPGKVIHFAAGIRPF